MRTVQKLLREFDGERAWETFKLTFCIIGVGGYAGYLSSMTLAFRIVSVITVSIVLFGIYRMTTRFTG